MADQFKRSIFLVNRDFQFKVSFIIASLVFLSSLAYPVIIYEIFNVLLSKFSISEVDAAELRDSFLVYIIIYQVIFTGIVFFIGVFVSHKVAGPIYKVHKYFEQIKSGEKFHHISFRKGDYFPELAEDVNQLCQHIDEKYQSDFKYIKEVTAYINNISLALPEDKKPVLREINNKLLEISNRYSSSDHAN